MKFVHVFIFALLGVHLTTASPQSFLSDSFSGLTRTAGGVAQRAVDRASDLANNGLRLGNDLARGAVERATDLAASGIVLGNTLARGAIEGATDLANTGVTLGHNVAREVVDNFGSFTRTKTSIWDHLRDAVTSTTSIVVRTAASTVQSLVNQVQDQAERLFLASEDKISEIKRLVGEQKEKAVVVVHDIIDELEDEIDGTSAEALARIQLIVDAFIDRTSEAVDECSEAVIAPALTLHRTIRLAVQNSFDVTDAVLEQIKQCASLNQLDLKGVTQCARDITTEAQNLKPLINQYGSLLTQVVKSGVQSIGSSPCVVSITKQIIADKIAIISKAREILRIDHNQL